MDDIRLLEKEEIDKHDCKYCIHERKMRTQKLYKTGQKLYVVGKYCPFVECPYNKNTSKT